MFSLFLYTGRAEKLVAKATWRLACQVGGGGRSSVRLRKRCAEKITEKDGALRGEQGKGYSSARLRREISKETCTCPAW